MNCFERSIKICKFFAVFGCFILPLCIAATIATGILTNTESPWFILPMMLSVAAIFPVIFGFTFGYMYKLQYKTAKTLFTDEEIQGIEKPLYLHIAIAEKAKKLMAEGKAKKDMSEYNEFRELVMLTKPISTYGRYYNI